MKEDVQIELDGLRIVTFSDSHITESYVSWLNDVDVVRFSEQRHFKHTLNSCRSYYDAKVDGDDLFLAIETGFGLHIGNVGVAFDRFNNVADLSILIGDKSFWGKGIGLMVWSRIIDYLFVEKNVRLVTAGTMSENHGMIRLMEKSNMLFEGQLRARFILEGKSINMTVASILNPRYE